MQDQNFKFVPAALKKDFTPTAIYITGAIVIALFLYSDAMTVAATLADGYPAPIPHLLAFGVVGAIDLVYFGMIFAFKNLFAVGKIARATFAFYLAMLICLGAVGLFSAQMVVSHIEALGAKTRSTKHAVNYSNDPALIAASDAVRSLQRQLAATDSSISGVARAASGMATASLGFISAARRDSGQVRRNNEFYAGRANRSALNVTSALNEMQRSRQSLQVALLTAQDRRDSIFTALDKRYRGRSAQDVIEADMGIDLKGRIAVMTQIGVLAVLLVLFMVSAAYSGKSEYFPIAFQPAGGRKGGDELAKIAAPAAPGTSMFALPGQLAEESKREYDARIARMFAERQFPEYVNATYLAGLLGVKGPRFSKLMHGKLGKSYNSKISKPETA